MLTADRSLLDELNFSAVAPYIQAHKRELARLKRLQNYYMGNQTILTREKPDGAPNNRVMCNHAKYITDMSTGYFIGNPVTYSGENMDRIKEWFRECDIDTVDMNIAKDAGICGRGYELVCMSGDRVPVPRSYKISPLNTFKVYDNTVQHKQLFAVYYYPDTDILSGLAKGYYVTVYTHEITQEYYSDTSLYSARELKTTANLFGSIPVIEYWNNEETQGDFEQVISLIDAYNTLMSDRINDKEAFVDAILLLINAVLGDTPEEESAAKTALRQERILSLPGESDARYLIHSFDESGVEVLRKALIEDIHKFSFTPCMTDENFAGNVSGVAMEYKLLGLESITKIKERYFKAGLLRRTELYSKIQEIKGGAPVKNPEPVFSRGLPRNLVEAASMVSQLEGLVPSEILLSLLPFIKDPKEAVRLMKKEKDENIQEQQRQFSVAANKPPAGEDDEE